MRIGWTVAGLAGLVLALAMGGSGDPDSSSEPVGVSERVLPPPAPAPSDSAGASDRALAAARFRGEVLRHLLEGATPEARSGGATLAMAPPPAARPTPSEDPRRPEDVDWDYVRRVQTGDVSGIPNERRAGLTLVEFDRLVAVPYLEELREEGRSEELQRLGLDLPTDWDTCAAAGTCWDRPDGQWRMPEGREPQPIEPTRPEPRTAWNDCFRDGSCYDRPDGEWRMPSNLVAP